MSGTSASSLPFPARRSPDPVPLVSLHRQPRAHSWLCPDSRVEDLSVYKAEGFFSSSGRMRFKASAGKAKRLHPRRLAVFPECSELGGEAEHLLKRVGSLRPHLPGACFC